MERLASWGWRRFGVRYFGFFFAFELVSAYLIAAGTVALLSFYQRMTLGEYAAIVLLSFVCIAIGIGYGAWGARGRMRPLVEWARGERGRKGAAEAWRSAVELPVEVVARSLWEPVVFVALPVSLFATIYLRLPWYSEIIVFAGAAVAISYSAVLHFF